jgi:hypothetical protein
MERTMDTNSGYAYQHAPSRMGQPSYAETCGHEISEYKLKATDTQKEKRNFPGVVKNQYYSLADMQEKYKYEQAGTTGGEGAAKIARTRSKKHPSSGKGHNGKKD